MIRTIEKAVYTRLVTDSALITALGGTAIYPHYVPGNVNLPAVVYRLYRGGEENITPIRSVDIVYVIQAVAETPAKAAELADLIRARMTELSCDPPWTAYRVQLTNVVQFVEQADRAQYWHYGGMYRIRAVSAE